MKALDEAYTKAKREFDKGRPEREQARDQVMGAAVMSLLRSGEELGLSLSTWMNAFRDAAKDVEPDRAWLLDDDALTDDGYETFKHGDRVAWRLRRRK